MQIPSVQSQFVRCEPSSAPLASSDAFQREVGLSWADWRSARVTELCGAYDDDSAAASSQRLDRLVLDCLPLMRQVVASTTWFDLDYAAPEAALGQRSATSIAPVLVAAVQAVLVNDPDVPRIAIRIRRIGRKAILMIAGKPRPGRMPVGKSGMTSASLVRLAIMASLGLSFRCLFGRNIIAMSVPIYDPSLLKN